MPKVSRQILRSFSNGLVSVLTCGAAIPSTVPLAIQNAEAKLLKGSVIHDIHILRGTAKRTMNKSAVQKAMLQAGDYSASVQSLAHKLQSMKARLAATQSNNKQLT